MNDITLTVIIAAYNAEKYIKKCIESVLCNVSQESADRTEILVIDDASTDKTSDIVRSFGDKVRLVRLEKNNGSIAKTRNMGLESAKGKYVTYLDSDDWYADGALDKIFEYINKFNPDIIRYGYTLVYPDGETKIPFGNPKELLMVNKADFKTEIYPKFIGGIGLNSVCLAIFRRDIAIGFRFPESFKTAEDAAFALEAYTMADTALFVPERLYCYYQSGAGLTGSGISLIKKYKYNFKLSGLMLKKLPEWGMNTPLWYVKTMLRPLVLTLDKLKRLG